MKQLLLIGLVAFTVPAIAAPPKKKPAKSAAPNNWYLVSMNGKPVGTLSESFSRDASDGELVTSQNWVSANGEVSEIETLTTPNDDLSPISFNLHYKGSAKELRLNAILQRNEHIADMHYKLIQSKPAPLKREEKTFPMAPQTIFYSSLPRYLARHASGMYTARAIMEDVRSLDYSVKILQIRRTSESRKFGALTCEQSFVSLNGPMAEFWVAKDGTLCQVAIPESRSLIELKPESEAKSAFKAAK